MQPASRININCVTCSARQSCLWQQAETYEANDIHSSNAMKKIRKKDTFKKPVFKPVYIQFIFNIKTTLHLRVVKLLLQKCYKIKLSAEFLQKGDSSCFVPPFHLVLSNLGYKLNLYAV